MVKLLRSIRRYLSSQEFSSTNYWEQRYHSGGNSGKGSYGELAAFKADFINRFVESNKIQSVVEFGCGDGNQLSLASYPKYIGLDVSPSILRKCREMFHTDQTKSFFLYNPECFVDNGGVFKSDLALSLDVLYHLVEDAVYQNYLNHLFQSAGLYVIIYSSNQSAQLSSTAMHEMHRVFTEDVKRLAPNWEMVEVVQNRYKPGMSSSEDTSAADFYVFKKVDA